LNERRFASPAEIVLQTFELPMAAFRAAEALFDPANAAVVRFRLEGASQGLIIYWRFRVPTVS
jgi:hypothetical protein